MSFIKLDAVNFKVRLGRQSLTLSMISSFETKQLSYLVEEKLELFICQIYACLFKAVFFKVFKTKDVQDTCDKT